VFTAIAQARRSFPADRRPAPENHLSTAKYYMSGLVATAIPTLRAILMKFNTPFRE